MKPLTNFEIDELLRGVPNYHGCFMKDEKIPTEDGYYVINLDKLKNSGTHWVCAIRGDDNIYFDSFGFVPPVSIARWMDCDFYFSDVQYQPDDSSTCGYYTVYMIKQVARGRQPLSVLFDFEQKPSPMNDALVTKN